MEMEERPCQGGENAPAIGWGEQRAIEEVALEGALPRLDDHLQQHHASRLR